MIKDNNKLCRDCARCTFDSNSSTTRKGKCNYNVNTGNGGDIIEVDIDDDCIYCRPERCCCGNCANWEHDYQCSKKGVDCCENYVHNGAYDDLVKSLEYLLAHGNSETEVYNLVDNAMNFINQRNIIPFIKSNRKREELK